MAIDIRPGTKQASVLLITLSSGLVRVGLGRSQQRAGSAAAERRASADRHLVPEPSQQPNPTQGADGDEWGEPATAVALKRDASRAYGDSGQTDPWADAMGIPLG